MTHLRTLVLACLIWICVIVGLSDNVYAAEVIDNPSPASAAALHATLVLTPTADTYIQSNAPSSNFATLPELQVLVERTVAIIDANALLQFDLALLPAGAIINRAELRLRQTAASGVNWSVNLNRVTSPWAGPTVTWNSRPSSTPFYTALAVPDEGGDPNVIFDVTDLVRTWAYGAAPNYGLEITGNGGASHARRFASANGAINRPVLFINYTPPPARVQIGEDLTAVTLDGQCAPRTEYSGAATFSFVDIPGEVTRVYLKHDATDIYLCIDAPLGRYPLRYFGIYLDTDFGREKYATDDDYALQARIVDGANSALRGAGNQNKVYEPTVLDGWKAVTTTGNRDGAEYQIARSLLNRACDTPFGLAIYHHDVRDNGEVYGLPVGRNFEFPATWLEATLAAPGCIRVCSESAIPCPLAAGATVLNTATGVTFATDSEGYILNRSQIAEGDPLWALWPVSTTDASTLYHTSGDPQRVTTDAFRGASPGVMTLVVTKQKPLLLQDLAISAQWYVQGDPVYASWLESNIRQASDYFYDFTNGQMALGRVTVYQDYEAWESADVELYASNHFRPEAEPGGIITSTISDPDDANILYHPGEAHMGATWNRYNLPGMPSTSTEDLSNDWALVLAHELGHYLLFLQDTYFKLGPDDTIVNVYSCTGSAMGWVYFPENSEFVHDQAHWDANCKGTYGNELLGRTEWNTMRTFHPWLIAPTNLITGPASSPTGITTVTFVAPPTPTLPLANQVFTLTYQLGESASPQARAFLVRNDRVIDQGKPAKGTTQIELHGAQAGDRFCLFDINNQPQAPETPRHQYGCESLEAGDNELLLERDPTWAPVILVDPVISTTHMLITVTQPYSGAALRARLYPEHTPGSVEVALTESTGVYTGLFELPNVTPAAYVQVWVDESESENDPRRGALIDYGVGGSGLSGPKSGYANAPIVSSSDGRAFFVVKPGVSLRAGEFIAIQSMAGTPPLPPGATLVAQTARLIALPPTLVASGAINLRFGGPLPLTAAQAPSEDMTGLAIHFWDGSTWQPLPTHFTTEPNGNYLASAPGRGSGIYALLNRPGQAVYLPLINR